MVKLEEDAMGAPAIYIVLEVVATVVEVVPRVKVLK